MAIPTPLDKQRNLQYGDREVEAGEAVILAGLLTKGAADNSAGSLTVNEQELVTIRPATPALSPNAPFPSKESRKLGETGETSEPHRSLYGDLIGASRVTSEQTTTTERPKLAPLGLKLESSSSLLRRAVQMRLGIR